eukprot:TRINITY_DN778_c0_g1_i1.p1 TRINITY_DN778_c0_g1~~TRINITY_DN778_c0_g1_i1.p1  ORF type:complete len:514 (-),score=137.89 TRINITY_DN778_c0_g1_i1:78-1619(-)
MRVRIFFDDRKFKTEKEPVGGGDVSWKSHFIYDYIQPSEHTSMVVVEFVKKQLEQKHMKIQVLCQHDEKTSGTPLGQCSVDLYTLATGPVDHNLSLQDGEGNVVGRMFFSVDMAQVTEVLVMLKEIHVKNLRSTEEDVFNLNPYLKYAYSKDWPAIADGKMKATYSETQYKMPSPSWSESQMPWLKFRASLNELVKESLVMHVTHKGKYTNTTLGRCNLLFRTLVDGGKSFKEEDLISFKGPLNKKDSGTTIEGRLLFKHLPIFAQMKPIAGGRQAVHTEKGIYDAMPLLTWVPRPSVPVFHSDTPSAEVGTPKTARKSRTRADSSEKKRAAEEGDKDNKFRQRATQSDGLPKDLKKKDRMFASAKEVPTGDLISFTPPNARKRAQSMAPVPSNLGASTSPAVSSSYFSNDDFVISHANNMFGPGGAQSMGNILTVSRVPVGPESPIGQVGPEPAINPPVTPRSNPFAGAEPAPFAGVEPTFNPFAHPQVPPSPSALPPGSPAQQPSFNPFAV